MLAGLLDEVGLPAWLSYSVAGRRTRAGQPLEDAFAVAASCGAVVATGVNCCSPDDVLPALEVAREVGGKPGVAYPNTGEGWDSGTHTWSGDAAYDVGSRPPGSPPVRRTSVAAAASGRMTSPPSPARSPPDADPARPGAPGCDRVRSRRRDVVPPW